MLELIPNLPDHVVGVVASGEVTATDYETVLIPAIESVLGRKGKVRTLYHVEPEFSGFTTGAMWEHMKVGMAHWHEWEKVAVVKDVDWIANATRLFGFAMPCPIKVFANKDLAEASRWITEP